MHNIHAVKKRAEVKIVKHDISDIITTEKHIQLI